MGYSKEDGTPVTAADACSTAYRITVEVRAPYKLLTGGFLGLFGVPQTLKVSGSETARIQGR